MDKTKIMCNEDFKKCFNWRIAEKCCENCKHGEEECDAYITCHHPKRNDGGYAYEEGETASKFYTYNSKRHMVCDLWETKETK